MRWRPGRRCGYAGQLNGIPQNAGFEFARAMSWVTILWSIDGAVCWSFGAMFLLVWLHQRKNLPYLLFAITASGVGSFAWFELALMRAPNPDTYANLIRWIHVPVWIVMVSLVCFVRLYLNAGRIWLAWSIIVTRTMALIVNFIVTPNLNFREITGLQYQPWFGGEQVAMAIGRPSPWTLIGQFSLLLFSIYVVDIDSLAPGRASPGVDCGWKLDSFCGAGLAANRHHPSRDCPHAIHHWRAVPRIARGDGISAQHGFAACGEDFGRAAGESATNSAGRRSQPPRALDLGNSRGHDLGDR
jgi:hypothetical protein